MLLNRISHLLETIDNTNTKKSVNSEILSHYKQFGEFTYPGLYQSKLKNDLPDNIKEIGNLLRGNIIHRVTLEQGGKSVFGNMKKVPWHRQAEDDKFPTASAMLTELYRRDPRGIVSDRKEEDKLILTCRYIAILMASILKSKGIPTRVRSGNASYFGNGNVSDDHWINQYWNGQRWVTIDVDGSWSVDSFNPYDIPDGKFDFPANAWLDIRNKKVNANKFHNAAPASGAIVVIWSLWYDFHCLMNDEIPYLHKPRDESLKDLKKIDYLANLMKSPDENFDKLLHIWKTDKDLRLLTGALL